MSTHNICLYKEVDIKYTGCNLKTMELLDCALIGVCAVIRSNTVGCEQLNKLFIKYNTHSANCTNSRQYWSWRYLLLFTYRIRSNYRTYPYKRTLMKFRSLQITASVLFIYFFIKAYVVGSHLNCIDLSMQFKWVPTTYAFIKKIRKKSHNHHQISLFLIFL